MKIIIVGGGKLGKDIADNMLERKYDVRLIEKNRAKCIELANDLDVGSRDKKCRLLYFRYRK